MKVEGVALSMTCNARGHAVCSVNYVLLVDEWELGHWIEETVGLWLRSPVMAPDFGPLVVWKNAPWALARAKDTEGDDIRLRRATPTQELKLDPHLDLPGLSVLAEVQVAPKSPAAPDSGFSPEVQLQR